VRDALSRDTGSGDRRADLEELFTLGLNLCQKPDAEQSVFSLRSQVVEYDGFNAAVRELARVHRRGLFVGDLDSFQMVGQTGSGKTTLLKWYAAKFPRYEAAGRTIVPVLYVESPEMPTVKGLASEILRQMGDPFFYKGTGEEMTVRIFELCKKVGVELIILDEIQHLIEGGRRAELRRLTDWLKRLINEVKCPIVLAGLPMSILVTRSNPQLRRRFQTPYYFEPFSFKSRESQMEFRGVLKVFAEQMPPGSINVASHDLARRMLIATAGLMDYIVKILNDAVSRGGSGDGGAVTMADLALSFRRTVWGNTPDRLNPFMPSPKLRVLNKPGEPFEMLDPIVRYLGQSDVTKSVR